MPKYKRKPVTVEAVKITRPISIQIGDDIVQGNPGDYLITDVNGEQYPCSADTFEQTYQPVKNAVDLKGFAYKAFAKLKRKIKKNM